MMKLFKRRNNRPSVAYRVFEKLGEAVDRRQRRTAVCLNQKTAGYSRRKWIWLLLGFTVLFGAAAVKVGLDSINSKVRVGKFQPGDISVPRLISQRRFMDSLADFEQWRKDHYKHLETIKNGNHGKKVERIK